MSSLSQIDQFLDQNTAHRVMASFFLDRGDWDRAIEHLRISINIDPTDSTKYIDLGTALAKRVN